MFLKEKATKEVVHFGHEMSHFGMGIIVAEIAVRHYPIATNVRHLRTNCSIHYKGCDGPWHLSYGLLGISTQSFF